MTIAILENDIDHLQRKLDRAVEEGNELEAESVERILSVKEGLLADEIAKRDAAESRAAREAAEARLAYHDDNDTLDLY